MNENNKDTIESGLFILIPVIELIISTIFLILTFLKIATYQTALFFVFIIYFFTFDIFILCLRHAFSYNRDVDEIIEDLKGDIEGFERLYQELQNSSNLDDVLKKLEKDIVEMKEWIQEWEREKFSIKNILTGKRRSK